MGIAFGHLKCFVSKDFGNFEERCPSHSHIGCCTVPQVVEAEVSNVCSFDGVLKGNSHTYIKEKRSRVTIVLFGTLAGFWLTRTLLPHHHLRWLLTLFWLLFFHLFKRTLHIKQHFLHIAPCGRT